jgi:hypothetical protein
MGLLDPAIFSPQSYGGAGGLLQNILRTAQINPTPSVGFDQAQGASSRSQPLLPQQMGQPQVGPTIAQGNQGSMGGVPFPIFGQPTTDNAQLPATSMPTQGAMPRPQTGGLFGGGHLLGDLGNTLQTMGGILAPRLSGRIAAQNVASSIPGITPDMARVVASNPTLLAGVVGNQLGIKDETNDVKNYKYGQNNPAFLKYLIDMKQAGSIKNQVQIDQRGESEFSKVAGKSQAERFDKLSADALDAKQMISDMQSLRDIGSRIATGKTAEVTAALGPYAEALGVKVDGLDDMQAYKAIVSRLAPRMRAPGSGSSSDTDVRMFLESLPGIGKTPGGNELIAQTFDAMARGKIAAAEIASKALTGEITRQEAEKQLRALPDPLALWKKSRTQQSGAVNQAPQAIPVPQQRQQGRVYQTPKGPARWMGNGWEMVQ